MHIYRDLLQSYTKRDLPEQQLAALDVHVSNCLFCAHALADEATATTEWERRGLFGRLVRVERQEPRAVPADEREARAA
jgi:hypothetical protein